MSDSTFVVACCYRLTPEDMHLRLQRLFKSVDQKFRGVIVTANVKDIRTISEGWHVLPSDNVDFDFSAYFSGANFFVKEGSLSREVLFVNDTLFTNHAAEINFQALWRQISLVRQIELPSIVGKIDRYTTICLKNPWSGLDCYVSSYCFLLNKEAVSILLSLPHYAERDQVNHRYTVNDLNWGGNLPPAFRQFLKANLVYTDSSIIWHQLLNLNYTPEQLQSKARSIYFEHRLSGQISSVGCLLPTNAGPRWSFYISVGEYLNRLRRIVTKIFARIA